MSVEEYRAMPEGPPYSQLIEGELINATDVFKR